MAVLTHSRVTIEFAGASWVSPEPQPDAWPPDLDLRLVESQAGEQRAFIRHKEGCPEYALSAEEVEHLLQLLTHMEVSAPWQPLCGMDGTIYELSLRDAMSNMTFRWWVKVPEAWEDVGKVLDYVISLGCHARDAAT